MTIEFSQEEADQAEKEAAREAREAALAAMGDLAGLEQIRIPPPPGLEAREPTRPPVRPQQLGRMAAETARDEDAMRTMADDARALGNPYRAQPPEPRSQQLPEGAAPDSPMRVYPAGTMPPPRSALERAADERDFAQREGFPIASRVGAPPQRPTWMPDDAATLRALAAAPPPQAPQLGARPQAQPPVLPARARGVSSPVADPSGIATALGDPWGPGPPPALPSDRRARMLSDAMPPGVAGAKRPGNPPPDYTGADVGDAFRRPLHVLGNALRGMLRARGVATPRTEFRSEGEAARARDVATAQRKQEGAESAEDRAERRAMAERGMSTRERLASSLERDRTQRAERMDQQAGTLDAYRARLNEIRQLEADGRIDANRALAARRQAEVDALRASSDPTSEAAARARQRLTQRVSIIEQATGRELDVDVEGLSVEDIEALERGTGVPRWTRPRAHGGGLTPEARAALETPPASWRESPEAWRAQTLRQRQQALRTLGTRQTRRGESESGTDWTPRGWHDVDRRDLDPQERRRIRDAGAESARLVGQIRRIQELASDVSALERGGAAAGVLSERLAEARGLHENINNGLRQAGNYGVPTGTELERMERLAPSLESTRAFVNGARQYEGILTAHRRAMDDWMGEYGVERGAGSGEPRPSAAQQSQANAAVSNVVIFRYGGRSRRVRAEDAEQARRQLRAANVEFTEEAPNAAPR